MGANEPLAGNYVRNQSYRKTPSTLCSCYLKSTFSSQSKAVDPGRCGWLTRQCALIKLKWMQSSASAIGGCVHFFNLFSVFPLIVVIVIPFTIPMAVPWQKVGKKATTGQPGPST